MKTLIKNGNVVLPDCSGFAQIDVLIENGKILSMGNNLLGDNVFDAKGKYILPGLIDIHNHGSIGSNFGNGNKDSKILRYLAEHGITTVLPTLGTNTIDVLIERIKNVLEVKKTDINGARIGGIHLEGPFISEEKKGAMMIESPACTVENFNQLIEAGNGEVKLMALAPERENALDVIREAVKNGIRISLGHTMATYAEAMAAINAGANHATHTFNAMRDYNHREPGVVGAVLTTDEVTCEVICDMIHLAPATVKLIRLAKSIDRMILISDSSLVTGVPDGEYEVDGHIRYVKDGVSRIKNGTIAASCFNMADGAKNLVKVGFTLADIARIGALNPAKAIGLEKELGTIELGKHADILICSEAMNIERVMLRGKFI